MKREPSQRTLTADIHKSGSGTPETENCAGVEISAQRFDLDQECFAVGIKNKDETRSLSRRVSIAFDYMRDLPRTLSGKNLKRREEFGDPRPLSLQYTPAVVNLCSNMLLRREREARLPCDLLFSEPHLWRNGFTGVPSAEEWRAAPASQRPFATRHNC